MLPLVEFTIACTAPAQGYALPFPTNAHQEHLPSAHKQPLRLVTQNLDKILLPHFYLKWQFAYFLDCRPQELKTKKTIPKFYVIIYIYQ